MTDAQLQAMLRAMAAHDEREEPSNRVELEVMRRWAERHATAAEDARPGRPFTKRTGRATRYVAAGAGLAAALILVAWAGQRGTEQDPPAAHVPEAAGVVQPEPAVAPAAPPVEVVAPVSVQVRNVARRPPADAAVDTRKVNRVESFASLQPLTERELFGIRVARVRLSGQAAERLGFTAAGFTSGTDGSIEADVLLGEDGMARAIRIVR